MLNALHSVWYAASFQLKRDPNNIAVFATLGIREVSQRRLGVAAEAQHERLVAI